MIVMSRERMAFVGPQVQSELILGGYVIYASTGQPLRLMIDDVESEKSFLAIVPPYTKHSLTAAHEHVRSILIEAETVSPDLLRDPRFVSGGSEARSLATRIEKSFQSWKPTGAYNQETDAFDLFWFGERLPPRELEKRVSLVANRIRVAPDAAENDTSAIAKSVALSPSRLRHLFCEQVGVPIRRFRAWKRLRNVIRIAFEEPNILKVAMAAGYADATHLCHSVRLYFGEQPTFVCAHWRRELCDSADLRLPPPVQHPQRPKGHTLHAHRTAISKRP